jgi:hypothetical protein
VRPQSGEVTVLRHRGLVECIANARIPHWLSWCSLLLEDEGVWLGTVLGCFGAVALDQVADSQEATAVLAFRAPDILVPDALLNLDRAGLEEPRRFAHQSRYRFR